MNENIAKRLEQYRKQKGLTQEALGEQIGVSRQAVSSWEQGVSSPDTDNLLALAKLYGVTVDDLLTAPDAQEDFKQRREAFFDMETEKAPEKTVKSRAASFPFPVLVTLIYFFIAFTTHLWHPTWLIFLTIPIYYTVVAWIDAARNGADRHWMEIFPYPILVVAVFLLLGFTIGYWEIIWVLFLTIPIYYIILKAIKNKGNGWRAIMAASFPLLAVIVFLLLGFLVEGAWAWAWLVFLTIPFWGWLMGSTKHK